MRHLYAGTDEISRFIINAAGMEKVHTIAECGALLDECAEGAEHLRMKLKELKVWISMHHVDAEYPINWESVWVEIAPRSTNFSWTFTPGALDAVEEAFGFKVSSGRLRLDAQHV